MSVVVYLIGAFAICIAALGTLMTLTTTSSFQRERDRALTELKSAARAEAESAADQGPETLGFMQTLATQPGLATLEPVACRQAFAGLASLLATPEANGHIEVYRADGSVVCELRSPTADPTPALRGPWFDKVLATNRPVMGDPSIDPITHTPAMTMAMPIAATNGRTGVMAVVLATGSSRLPLPGGATKQTVLVELDPTRTIVLGTSAGTPVSPGLLPEGSWMERGLKGSSRTMLDADGTSRLYTEVTAANGWHVLAGVPKGVALAPAQVELRRNLILGGAVVLLVAGLGFILERRLARPIRSLRMAIEAAKSDGDARAHP